MSSRNTAPIVLVVIALLGSVAIPARQTWLISELLHQTTQTLAPARLLASQLHAGLAEELALLRAPGAPGDDSSLARFRVLADSDDQRVANLVALAGRLDTATIRGIAVVQDRIAAWRRVSNSTMAAMHARQIEGDGPMRAIVVAHGAALSAVSDVATALDAQAAARDIRMGELDRTGLGWNIILVIAAFAGLSAVVLLMARERQAHVDTQARARREVAMREAAESFAGAFTLKEIEQRVSDAGPTVQQDRVFGHLAALATEKVRTLEEARAGRDRLDRVLKSRSRLIRGFSHDVKNPIGAADGYAALLAEGIYGELTPAQRESVQRIRRSIHTALGLINDLNELAAAETGHLELRIEPVDVKALVGGLVDDYAAAARAAGLRLEPAVADDVALILTSGTRVRQVLSNLISNAIKYAERGAVVVSAARTAAGPEGQPGLWVRIDVADEGPGIPPEKHEFIFEEFGRIAPSAKSGAGLGLAISRLLAEALGGRLTVASTPGAGSTFSLWLPTRRAVDERRGSTMPRQLEALSLGLSGGTSDGADARPHRVEEERERRDL